MLAQAKKYCRDALWQTERLRVRLHDDEGHPLRSDVPDRKALYRLVCQGLLKHPQLATRRPGGVGGVAQPAAGAVAAGQGGGGKRKGKGKSKGKS